MVYVRENSAAGESERRSNMAWKRKRRGSESQVEWKKGEQRLE